MSSQELREIILRHLSEIRNSKWENCSTMITPIHPGKVLKTEFLDAMGITQYRLAKTIGVTPIRINSICAGKRAVTADTALRLARALGTSPKFWLALQADFDLGKVLQEHSEIISHIEPLVF